MSSSSASDPTRSQVPTSHGTGSSDTPVIDDLQRDLPSMHRPSVAGYQITGVLGHGARGVVYEAQDKDGDQVALKVMTELPNMVPSEIQRFLREADASKKLRRHPHIISVYETGKSGNDRYICMEMVPRGHNLKHKLQEASLSIDHALRIAIAIAEALAYAHDKGVLHRDLKPSNVLINEFGEPLLADFGLAKSLDGQDLTMTGEFMGTPRYMSPEQVSSGNKSIGPASDQYSFGVMLYEMLTGSFPYPVDPKMGFLEVIDIIKVVPPLPPRKLNAALSPDVETILLKLLEKNPEHRYPSMHAVVRDLKACLHGQSISAKRPSWGKRSDRWFWRHRTILVVLMMTSAFSSLFWIRHRQLQHQQTEQTLGTALQAASSARYEEKARQDMRRARADSALAKARANLVAGHYTQAQQRFLDVMHTEDLDYDQRQLARFEAALCAWLDGQQDAARTLWQGVPPVVEGPTASVDRIQRNRYVRNLNLVMAGSHEPTDLATDLATHLAVVSEDLRGLGHWVLAHQAADGEARHRHLTQAYELAGETYTWMSKE